MSDLPPLYACAFCGCAIRPLDPGTWRQVTGWVEHRTGGGAHAVSFPSAPHAYACRQCMFDRKLKADRNQDSLF